MTTATLTPKTYTRIAQSFIKSFDDGDIYAFAGKGVFWKEGGGLAGEQNPPEAVYSYNHAMSIMNNMIFAKKLNSSNAHVMIARTAWVDGYVYDSWDPKSVSINDKSYVVIYNASTKGFDVYLCIDNNYNSPSTVKPTLISTSFFRTSDGYIWKWMFDISKELFDRWVSPNVNTPFVPVPISEDEYTATLKNNIDALQYTVPRIFNIYSIVLGDNGQEYDIISREEITSIKDWKEKINFVIEGDGSGAEIKNFIMEKIPGMVSIPQQDTTDPINYYKYKLKTIVLDENNKGKGYSTASIKMDYVVEDADDKVNFKIINQPKIKVIIDNSPMLGISPAYDIGARFVTVTASFKDSEHDYFPTSVKYRQVGLIKNIRTNITNDIIKDDRISFAEYMDLTDVKTSFETNTEIIGIESKATAQIIACETKKTINGTEKEQKVTVINRFGEFKENESLESKSINPKTKKLEKYTSGKLKNYEYSDVSKLFGDVIYYQNIPVIARENSKEEIFYFTIEM